MYDTDRIKSQLLTNLFGSTFIFEPEVDSSNAHLMRLAREGAPEGTVVLTAFQTKGKGRLNRTWLSRKGENMLISLLIRPGVLIDSVQKITLASAVILIEAVQSFMHKMKLPPFDICVKWPNDLMVDGKKLAGILAESILQGKTVEALVVGFGLNINTSADALPEEIRDSATSLREKTGQAIEIEDFVAHFLNTFEREYLRLNRKNFHGIITEWKKHCMQFGQVIKVQHKGKTEEAVFEDINDQGHLIYRLPSGTVARLISGDMNLLK